MTQLTRRSIIASLASLIVAPAIVRASSIMPISAQSVEYAWQSNQLHVITDMQLVEGYFDEQKLMAMGRAQYNLFSHWLYADNSSDK